MLGRPVLSLDAKLPAVMRGLDPRIHLLRKKLFSKTMDCRVKPRQ